MSVVDDEFEYGSGKDAVVLTARIPIWMCDTCEENFTDWRAEEARHNAVCDHLGRLRPSEIQSIRRSYDVSQDDFAKITGIGVASIKRWEAGSLIQGESFDRYLRLLKNDENFMRLKRREQSRFEERRPRFRTILPPDSYARSEAFQLRPRAQVAA